MCVHVCECMQRHVFGLTLHSICTLCPHVGITFSPTVRNYIGMAADSSNSADMDGLFQSFVTFG